MEQLEKEREEFVSQLSPESLKEFRQKEEELNHQKLKSDTANPEQHQQHS
jgi:hypothetical protein